MSFREIAVFAVTNEFLDSRLRGNDSYEMACRQFSIPTAFLFIDIKSISRKQF
jgi:hypothetical protein